MQSLSMHMKNDVVGPPDNGMVCAMIGRGPRRKLRALADHDIWAALHDLELQTRDAVYEQLGDAAARFTTAERPRSSTMPSRTSSRSPSWRPLGLNTTGAWRCTVMAHTIEWSNRRA
jgi:hypothetical protein